MDVTSTAAFRKDQDMNVRNGSTSGFHLLFSGHSKRVRVKLLKLADIVIFSDFIPVTIF
jgi:hypothetical protein